MEPINVTVKSPKVALPGLDHLIERMERADALLDILAARAPITIKFNVTGDEHLQVAATNVESLAAAFRGIGEVKIGDGLAKGLISPGEAAKYAASQVEKLKLEFKALNETAVASTAKFQSSTAFSASDLEGLSARRKGIEALIGRRNNVGDKLSGMERAGGMAEVLAGGNGNGNGAVKSVEALAKAEVALAPASEAAAEALAQQHAVVAAKVAMMDRLTQSTMASAKAEVAQAEAAKANAQANEAATVATGNRAAQEGLLSQRIIRNEKGEYVDTVSKVRTGPGETITQSGGGTVEATDTREAHRRAFEEIDAEYAGRRADQARSGIASGSPEHVQLLRDDAAARSAQVAKMAEQGLGTESLADKQRVLAAQLEATAHAGEKTALRKAVVDAEAGSQERLNTGLRDQVALIDRSHAASRGAAADEHERAAADRTRAAEYRDLAQTARQAESMHGLATDPSRDTLLRGLETKAARLEADAQKGETRGTARTRIEDEAKAQEQMNTALRERVALIDREHEVARGAALTEQERADAARQRANAYKSVRADVEAAEKAHGVAPSSARETALRGLETRGAGYEADAQVLESRALKNASAKATEASQERLNNSLRDEAALIDKSYEASRGMAQTEEEMAKAVRQRAQEYRALHSQTRAAETAGGLGQDPGREGFMRGLEVRASRMEANAKLVEDRIAATRRANADASRQMQQEFNAFGGTERTTATERNARGRTERSQNEKTNPVTGERERIELTRRWDEANRELEPSLTRTTRAMGEQGNAFVKSIGTAATWIAAYAVIGKTLEGLKSGFDAATRFERTFATLQAVFRGTNAEALALGNTALELGAKEGRSGDEAADAAVRWARLGLTRKETAEAIDVSLQAANVAEITAAEGAEKLSSIFASYRLEVGDLRTVLNELNTVSNTLNVTNKDLLGGIARTGSIAKQAGVPLAELIGIIGAGVSRTGRSGAEIGNAVKSTIVAIANPEIQKTLQGVFGFNVKTPLGALKDMSQVFSELYLKVQQMDSGSRGELLQKLGGKQQASRLQAIFDSYVTAEVKAIQAQTDLNSAERESGLIRGTVVSQLQSMTTEFQRLFYAMLTVGGEDSALGNLRSIIGVVTKLEGAIADAPWVMKLLGGVADLGGVGATTRGVSRLFGGGGADKQADQLGVYNRDIQGATGRAGAAELSARLAETLAKRFEKGAPDGKAADQDLREFAGVTGGDSKERNLTGEELVQLREQHRWLELSNKLRALGVGFTKAQARAEEEATAGTAKALGVEEEKVKQLQRQIDIRHAANKNTSDLERQLAEARTEIERLKGNSKRKLLKEYGDDDGSNADRDITARFHDKTETTLGAVRSLFEKGIGGEGGDTETSKLDRKEQAIRAERAAIDRLEGGKQTLRPTDEVEQQARHDREQERLDANVSRWDPMMREQQIWRNGPASEKADDEKTWRPEFRQAHEESNRAFNKLPKDLMDSTGGEWKKEEAVRDRDVAAAEQWRNLPIKASEAHTQEEIDAQGRLNVAIGIEVQNRREAADAEEKKIAILRETAALQDGLARGGRFAKDAVVSKQIGKNATEQDINEVKGIKTDLIPAALARGGAEGQGEAIGYANRLLEIQAGLSARRYSIEKDIANERIRQNTEASKALLMASREEQLRAALLGKFTRDNGKLSAESFQFLDKDTREAAHKFSPDSAPDALGSHAQELEAERELLKANLEGINTTINAALDALRKAVDPGTLLAAKGGGAAAPQIQPPNVVFNLGDQFREMTASLFTLTEGRINAEMADIRAQVAVAIAGNRISRAQGGGASSINA